MRTINVLLVACGTLFAVMPVFAGSASATVSDIRIELIDLDLDDGISPSLTFTGRGEPIDVANRVTAVAEDEAAANFQKVELKGYTPFAPNSATASTAVSFASASLSGDGTAAGSTFSTSGYAFSTEPPFRGHYPAYFSADASTIAAPYYVLSANTRVVLTAVADLAAEALPGAAWEYIYARTAVYLASGDVNFSDWRYLSPPAGVSRSITDELLEVSLSNRSNSSIELTLWVQASSWGQSVHAVPESDAYLLMLAGLALTACVGRRRGRSRDRNATLRSCAAADRAGAAAS